MRHATSHLSGQGASRPEEPLLYCVLYCWTIPHSPCVGHVHPSPDPSSPPPHHTHTQLLPRAEGSMALSASASASLPPSSSSAVTSLMQQQPQQRPLDWCECQSVMQRLLRQVCVGGGGGRGRHAGDAAPASTGGGAQCR